MCCMVSDGIDDKNDVMDILFGSSTSHQKIDSKNSTQQNRI